MKFCKSVSPIVEVHQMKLLGCIGETTYERIPISLPEVCFSPGVPVREKKSQ